MSSDPSRGQDERGSSDQIASDAIVPYGEALDRVAQERFGRTDWIELAAAVLLSLATVAAAWSAYQATRWGGVQANSFSAAGAKRVEATQATNLYAAGVQVDVQTWIAWLEQAANGDEAGETFLYDRFREEFKPAFDAWLALVPVGEPPPGTPFDLPEYAPADAAEANRLNDEANALADTARHANQTGDNFVLSAVIMASVLFFAGVGTKLKARAVRLMMLTSGTLLFLGGLAFMLSMPQNVGL
jgi:hypothetical protein